MAILGRAQAYAPHLPRLLQYGAPPAVKVLVSRRVTGGRREPIMAHTTALLSYGQSPPTRIIVSRRVTGGQSRGFAPVGRLTLSKLYTYTPPAPTPPIPSAVFVSRRVDRRGAPRIRPYLTGLIGFQPAPAPTIPVQSRLKIDRNAATFQIPPGLDAAAQKLAEIVSNTFLRENRNWRTLNIELYGPDGTDAGRTTINVSGGTHMSGDIEIDAGEGIAIVQTTATRLITISLVDDPQTLNVIVGAAISGGNLVLTTKDITFHGTISNGADITITGTDCT